MIGRYKVKGLHCPSCEVLIEEKLGERKGIKKVKVNLAKNEIEIESESKIELSELNKLFKKDGYSFSEIGEIEEKEINMWWWIPAVGIIWAFLLLNKLGLASFLNINNQSSLFTFFVFGIIAGCSTCGALMSGIILSFPKKTEWLLTGRIISYTILGAILGFVGQNLVKAGLTNILIILVSMVMIVTALQMLQIKWAQQIKLNLPKSVSKKIMTKKTPFWVGLLTVLLPCGFTLMAEGAAAMNGYWMGGMMIMLAFVLGSSIPLFLIGWSSEKFLKSQKTMGLLILFFVIYNLNFQFGWIKFSKSETNSTNIEETNQQTVEVVKVSYTRFGGLDPNPIEVKVDQKVRLEINVKENEFGCMSTILLPGLFNRPQTLTKGKILTMEFTPTKVGIYQFTCAMGVPHKGVINVTE